MNRWAASLGCLIVAAVTTGTAVLVRGDGDGDGGATRAPTSANQGIPPALVATSGLPVATEEPGRIQFVTPGPPPGDPRPLTAQECLEAQPRMEAQVALMAPKIVQLGPAEGARFEAAVEESRAWFDAGCPPHETLGYYPSSDGSSLGAILIDF